MKFIGLVGRIQNVQLIGQLSMEIRQTSNLVGNQGPSCL